MASREIRTEVRRSARGERQPLIRLAKAPFVTALLALTNCADRVRSIPLQDSTEIVVVAPIDGQRLTGTFQTLTPGETNVFSEASSESLLVISFSEQNLFDLHPGYRSRLPDSARLFEAKPPLTPRLASAEGDWVVSALPETARLRIVTFDDDLAAPDHFRSQITLQFPIDTEYCRDPSLEIQPYGASVGIFDPALWGEVDPNLIGVVAVDRDRAVVLSSKVVAPISRHGRANPATAFVFDEFSYASTIAHDPVTGDVWVGGFRQHELAGTPEIWHFRVSARGLDFIGTATISAPRPADASARALVVDRSGNVLAGGANGLFWLKNAGDDTFRAAAHPRTGRNIDAVAVGPSADRPHFVASDDSEIFVGDAESGRWDDGQTLESIGFRVYGLATADDGEMWAAGQQGLLARSKDGPFSRVPAYLPSSAAGCAAITERGAELGALIRDLVVFEDRVVLALDDCAGVIVVQRGDPWGCKTPVSFDGAFEVSSVDANALASAESGVIMVGSSGTMRELVRRSP